MNMNKEKLKQKPAPYRFEFKHLLFVLVVLIIAQILISIYQKSSLKSFLVKTQKWYQQDSAERLANLTSTSLELLVDNINSFKFLEKEDKQKAIQSFNIIFSQQLLQQNVREVCLIFVNDNDHIIAIDNGKALFDFLSNRVDSANTNIPHPEALKMFKNIEAKLKSSEQITSSLDKNDNIHIFVPFVPKGEFLGALYMKNKPDFSFITTEFISSFDVSSIIYSSIILLGLLATYLITSYSLRERDRAQALFFSEREEHIKEQTAHEKESHFTKRIYHAHHKAEKVMGYIKEDLKKIVGMENDGIKFRALKYANFISRVIYNMKWFEPPVKTLRSLTFKTNLNEVIKFIVENIFFRISSKSELYNFDLQLDDTIPLIHINEYAVWEVIEPLIQNSIDHSEDEKILITIKTENFLEDNNCKVKICDNGKGIIQEFLETNEKGIKKLFLENVTSKSSIENRGYGCYIAYELSKRCGWSIDAYNIQPNGCCFEIIISTK